MEFAEDHILGKSLKDINMSILGTKLLFVKNNSFSGVYIFLLGKNMSYRYAGEKSEDLLRNNSKMWKNGEIFTVHGRKNITLKKKSVG